MIDVMISVDRKGPEMIWLGVVVGLSEEGTTETIGTTETTEIGYSQSGGIITKMEEVALVEEAVETETASAVVEVEVEVEVLIITKNKETKALLTLVFEF